MYYGLITAKELAQLIECDISRIYAYVDLGIPYQEEYVNDANREIKLFDEKSALEWIRDSEWIKNSKNSKKAAKILTTYGTRINNTNNAHGIKPIMDLLGLNLNDIGNMIGAKSTAIHMWAMGKRRIPQNRLEMLSEVLDVDPRVITGEYELTDLDKVRLFRKHISNKLGKEVILEVC